MKTKTAFNNNYIEIESSGENIFHLPDEICPDLKNLINNLKKTTDAWKICVFVKIIFRSSKDNGEEREMFSRIENLLVAIGYFNKDSY